MKVSEFIHLLKHLPPDMDLYHATGPSSWGELDLMDEDSPFQCYVGSNPDDHDKTVLIFHEHYAVCKEVNDWMLLKDYLADNLVEQAAIKIIVAFLSEDPRWAGNRLAHLHATAADMIGLAKRGGDWRSVIEKS